MAPEKQFFALGECMLELSGAPGGSLTMAYGGDTLNTCVYLARLGMATAYVTVLGDDANSGWLLEQWQNEGIDTQGVTRLAGGKPGLYWIHLDTSGERSFSYWRGESAARSLLGNDEQMNQLHSVMADGYLCYLSGITLSILSPHARERLWHLLDGLRAKGVLVAFDSNFRSAGWASADVAREAFERTLSHVDIALPTFGDEALLYGDETAAHTADRLHTHGVSEVVVKQDAEGCRVSLGSLEAWIPAMPVRRVVDTTAAGDAFNAAYLAARYQGLDCEQAAARGHQLAAEVIQFPGAIIPRDVM